MIRKRIRKGTCSMCNEKRVLAPTLYGPYSFVCKDCYSTIIKEWYTNE